MLVLSSALRQTWRSKFVLLLAAIIVAAGIVLAFYRIGFSPLQVTSKDRPYGVATVSLSVDAQGANLVDLRVTSDQLAGRTVIFGELAKTSEVQLSG